MKFSTLSILLFAYCSSCNEDAYGRGNAGVAGYYGGVADAAANAANTGSYGGYGGNGGYGGYGGYGGGHGGNGGGYGGNGWNGYGVPNYYNEAPGNFGKDGHWKEPSPLAQTPESVGLSSGNGAVTGLDYNQLYNSYPSVTEALDSSSAIATATATASVSGIEMRLNDSSSTTSFSASAFPTATTTSTKPTANNAASNLPMAPAILAIIVSVLPLFQ